VWLVLALVLASALAIGTTKSHGTSSPVERANALDNELRCPSCDDVSVADSSAASAVAIRQLVLTDFEQGIPQASVISYLESRYPGILLRPSAGGIEGLVWFAPLAAFVIAACVIGSVFWRRQRAAPPAPPAAEDRKIVAEALVSAKTPATSSKAGR